MFLSVVLKNLSQIKIRRTDNEIGLKSLLCDDDAIRARGEQPLVRSEMLGAGEPGKQKGEDPILWGKWEEVYLQFERIEEVAKVVLEKQMLKRQEQPRNKTRMEEDTDGAGAEAIGKQGGDGNKTEKDGGGAGGADAEQGGGEGQER